MSRRAQIVLFIVMVLAITGIFFGRGVHKQPEPKVYPPYVGGDELGPNDKIYADGRISIAKDALFTRDAVLFITVYPKGNLSKPLAKRQMKNPSFPMRLFISSADNIEEGPFYAGDVTVSLLFSLDGTETVQPRNWQASADISKKSKRLVNLRLKPVGAAS